MTINLNYYNNPEHNATNETAFVEIFATRSWLHLDAVSNLYVMRYEYPLELVIRENLQYSAYDSMMNVCKYSKSILSEDKQNDSCFID